MVDEFWLAECLIMLVACDDLNFPKEMMLMSGMKRMTADDDDDDDDGDDDDDD